MDSRFRGNDETGASHGKSCIFQWFGEGHCSAGIPSHVGLGFNPTYGFVVWCDGKTL